MRPISLTKRRRGLIIHTSGQMNGGSIDPGSDECLQVMEYQGENGAGDDIETQRPLEIEEKKDIISTMPDGITGNILSGLSIKEAAMTSILAKKWRYQWTNFFGILNFDSSLDTFELSRKSILPPRKCNIFISKWERFMRTLELVMDSVESPCLQGLRICLEMGCPDKLVEWFKFAAKKNVQILDLDFSLNFSTKFFPISIETIRNVLPLKKIKMIEMKSLCVLRLASVDVSGVVVEYLLKHCPSLETLFIKSSKLLGTLEVYGKALRLKHLELIECDIVYLSISAENLITFIYSGSYGIIIRFENIPRLMKASFGGMLCSYLQSHLSNVDIFRLISQLEVLKLELRPWDTEILHDLPVFNNVRHLELQIPHEYGAELDRPVSLLGAFPSIGVLKIKFSRSSFMVGEPEQQWKANLQFELPNLVELELSGYKKDPSQLELLTKISERAPNLNKIIVDSLHPRHAYKSPDVKAKIRQLSHDATIYFADGLKPYVPPPVELVVL